MNKKNIVIISLLLSLRAFSVEIHPTNQEYKDDKVIINLKFEVDSNKNIISTITFKNISRRRITLPTPELTSFDPNNNIFKAYNSDGKEIMHLLRLHGFVHGWTPHLFKLKRGQEKNFRFNLSDFYCVMKAKGKYNLICSYNSSTNSKWKGKTDFKDIIISNLDTEITPKEAGKDCFEAIVKKHDKLFSKSFRDSVLNLCE